MTKRRKLNNKGLTLMELAVSLGIFSIVLVTSVFVLSSAHQLSVQSRERLLALNLARTTIETIKNTPLANMGGVQATVNNPADPNYSIPAELRNCSVNIDIDSDTGNLATATLATITVQVLWNSRGNVTPQADKQLDITTMRSRF